MHAPDMLAIPPAYPCANLHERCSQSDPTGVRRHRQLTAAVRYKRTVSTKHFSDKSRDILGAATHILLSRSRSVDGTDGRVV